MKLSRSLFERAETMSPKIIGLSYLIGKKIYVNCFKCGSYLKSVIEKGPTDNPCQGYAIIESIVADLDDEPHVGFRWVQQRNNHTGCHCGLHDIVTTEEDFLAEHQNFFNSLVI
jgi:hypothetical protein